MKNTNKLMLLYNTLHRDLRLFLKSPKDYIYTYSYPANKKINIQPYDPKVTKIGNNLVKKINKSNPNIKIHFLGSAALRIPGQRDIDLLAPCKPERFNKHLPAIISAIGKPKKVRKKFIEWHFTKNHCSVTFLLIDPSHYKFYESIQSYILLKKNKKLLIKYKALKISASKISVREYERSRMAFFNELVAK